MLLGTLVPSFLGNILAGINKAREGVIEKRQDRGILRANYGNKKI